MKIKNLAELKRVLQVGTVINTINHWNSELIGQERRVNSVQTNAVYAIVHNQPDHELSTCNGGLGSFMPFGKASQYEFGDTIKWYRKPIGEKNNELIMEFQVIPPK